MSPIILVGVVEQDSKTLMTENLFGGGDCLGGSCVRLMWPPMLIWQLAQ